MHIFYFVAFDRIITVLAGSMSIRVNHRTLNLMYPSTSTPSPVAPKKGCRLTPKQNRTHDYERQLRHSDTHIYTTITQFILCGDFVSLPSQSAVKNIRAPKNITTRRRWPPCLSTQTTDMLTSARIRLTFTLAHTDGQHVSHHYFT